MLTLPVVPSRGGREKVINGLQGPLGDEGDAFVAKRRKNKLTAQGIALGSFCHKRNAPYRGKSNTPTPSDASFRTLKTMLSHPRINAFTLSDACFRSRKCMLLPSNMHALALAQHSCHTFAALLPNLCSIAA